MGLRERRVGRKVQALEESVDYQKEGARGRHEMCVDKGQYLERVGIEPLDTAANLAELLIQLCVDRRREGTSPLFCSDDIQGPHLCLD